MKSLRSPRTVSLVLLCACGAGTAFSDTTLHWAARNGQATTVAALVAAGTPADTPDADGMTPLHFAAQNGQLEVVRILLAAGADPQARNALGRTPMHYAAWSDNPAGAFDFPLRDRLKDLCDAYGYSLKNLPAGGTLLADRPLQAVTFVENHDVARSHPIIRDKILAYAFILTHEGYPCVFWQDYFNWDLAKPESPNGIAALVKIHENHAGGGSRVLYVDNDLYVMQREGMDRQKGLVLVINNQGDRWSGARVQTRWRNTRFIPAVWSGQYDLAMPEEKWSDGEGLGDFWAAPRGFAVYIPQE